MDYFKELPVVQYPSLEDGGSTSRLLTNILTRSAFLREIVENTALFYEYQVKDAETPEIIADKLYGDPKRYWIVLLFNQLSDPAYDFPLTAEQLHDFIISKYDQSLEDSQTTIHHYEERVKRTTFYLNAIQNREESVYTISAQYQNPNTGVVENRPYLPGVADTNIGGPSYTETFTNNISVEVSTSYWAISNYAFEVDHNEQKRNIKLLDKAYVIPVENEFKRLMRNGI